MAEIEIKSVAGKTRPFSHNGKDFIDYGIKVGDLDNWHSWVGFANQDGPQAGDVLTDYSITPEEKYSDKIRGKLVRKASSGGAPTHGTAKDTNKINRNDQQVSIVRQHSQEMAIRWLARQPKPEAYTLDDLREVIKWFESDAWGDDPTAPTSFEHSDPDNDIPF